MYGTSKKKNKSWTNLGRSFGFFQAFRTWLVQMLISTLADWILPYYYLDKLTKTRLICGYIV